MLHKALGTSEKHGSVNSHKSYLTEAILATCKVGVSSELVGTSWYLYFATLSVIAKSSQSCAVLAHTATIASK